MIMPRFRGMTDRSLLRLTPQGGWSLAPGQQPPGSNIGELMYGLPCPRGHYTMATAPQITRAIRHFKGRQVRLQGQFG